MKFARLRDAYFVHVDELGAAPAVVRVGEEYHQVDVERCFGFVVTSPNFQVVEDAAHDLLLVERGGFLVVRQEVALERGNFIEGGSIGKLSKRFFGELRDRDHVEARRKGVEIRIGRRVLSLRRNRAIVDEPGGLHAFGKEVRQNEVVDGSLFHVFGDERLRVLASDVDPFGFLRHQQQRGFIPRERMILGFGGGEV